MNGIRLLLGNDLRRLRRSPVLAAGLVLYPLLIAVLVGLVVRYAGERPRVALVDQAGLPSTILLGTERFDLQRLFEQAAQVDLVSMDADEARRQLDNGSVLATLTIPQDFTQRLRRLKESPHLTLETTGGALGTRVVEKMDALVYAVNLKLQQAFIQANLAYVELLQKGGSGQLGDNRVSVLGLERTRKELERLAGSDDPDVAATAGQLAAFTRQVQGALGEVGAFLRATANPVVLDTRASGGRTWILSAQVQAYALALALAFVSVLLGAAAITAEREEQVLRRLVRGLVSFHALVAEKVAFVAIVGGAVGLLLAVAFGAVVEVSGVTGGQPWARLPLLAGGLALAAAAFGALGVLLGALAREVGAAMLLALLVGLPVALLGVLPPGTVPVVGWIGDLGPFGHAVDLARAALFDLEPLHAVLREAAWLAGLAAAYGLAARVAAPRLLL